MYKLPFIINIKCIVIRFLCIKIRHYSALFGIIHLPIFHFVRRIFSFCASAYKISFKLVIVQIKSFYASKILIYIINFFTNIFKMYTKRPPHLSAGAPHYALLRLSSPSSAFIYMISVRCIFILIH